MESNIEETDLDISKTNEQIESMDLKIKTNPKPFTIESLIGDKCQNLDNLKDNLDKTHEYNDDNRHRELLYQQHYLATATGSLSG